MRHPEWEAQGGSKPIVLAVDDIPDNLSAISEMVRALGVDVRAATNGPTALRYARLEPRPDLILLDVMMPGMDGHAVLAELRAQPETCDIPVIFVTALTDPRGRRSRPARRCRRLHHQADQAGGVAGPRRGPP